LGEKLAQNSPELSFARRQLAGTGRNWQKLALLVASGQFAAFWAANSAGKVGKLSSQTELNGCKLAAFNSMETKVKQEP